MFSTAVTTFQLIILISVSLTVSGLKCPNEGWYPFGGKCFLFKQVPGTLQDNYKYCRSLNATVVSIHSKRENDYLMRILKSDTPYWLGLQQFAAGVPAYTWSDGSVFNYSRWLPGEPNNLDVRCLGGVYINGYWEDVPCEFKRGNKLCQKVIIEEMEAVKKHPVRTVDTIFEFHKEIRKRVFIVSTNMQYRIQRLSIELSDIESLVLANRYNQKQLASWVFINSGLLLIMTTAFMIVCVLLYKSKSQKPSNVLPTAAKEHILRSSGLTFVSLK